MKILNLYAGIGGNRKLWPEKHEIVAVEKDQDVAQAYQDFFPKDKVVVQDAHNYLLENYQEFDFIWSSPPCKTHSSMKRVGVEKGQYKAEYPDMRLYQEIAFLDMYFKGEWVVENTKSGYEPLIEPQKVGRHFIWSSYQVPNKDLEPQNIVTSTVEELENKLGFDLSGYSFANKGKIEALRNCVDPKLGLHIFNSRGIKQPSIQEVVSS